MAHCLLHCYLLYCILSCYLHCCVRYLLLPSRLPLVKHNPHLMWCDVWVWASALQPHTQNTHTHSLSLVLVVMIKSKELKTKISHTHSLILPPVCLLSASCLSHHLQLLARCCCRQWRCITPHHMTLVLASQELDREKALRAKEQLQLENLITCVLLPLVAY